MSEFSIALDPHTRLRRRRRLVIGLVLGTAIGCWCSFPVTAIFAQTQKSERKPPAKKTAADPTDERVKKLLDQSQQAAGKGDLEKAIQLAEESLKLKPDDRGTLFTLARLEQTRGLQLIKSKKTKEGYALFVVAAERMQTLRKQHEKLTPAEQTFFATAL